MTCLSQRSLASLAVCQSATLTKRLCARCAKRPTTIRRLLTKNCSPLPSYVANYARLRNGLNQSRLTHRASKRSSNCDRFSPRATAFSTLISVSVTECAFLPSGLRPAPFRFPPRFDLITSFLLTTV